MKRINKNNLTAFSLIEISIVILVISLIVAGVSQGIGMYYEFNLKTARSLSRSSEVALYPGLVLWLDATAENSITNTSNSYKLENNDTVKTWIDQNPQAIDSSRLTLTEKASGEGPIYLEKGINGLPSLYFDYASSAGDGLYVTSTPNLSQSQFTIFAVTMPIEDTTYYGTIVMNRYTAGFTGFTVGKSNANKFYLLTGDSTAFNAATDSSTITFNTSYILTSVRNGATSSSNSILYSNSIQVASNTSVFVPNTTSNTQFCVGTSHVLGTCTGTLFYDGYISEIIMYNRALKGYERQAIEKYLSQKYKIKLG